MRSCILTVLIEILLLQYAWAGPFACVKCPIDDSIEQCPGGCNEDEECKFVPRTCETCQYYECQPIRKAFTTNENINEQFAVDASNLQQPAMVPCPRCVNCYDCTDIPQFLINCPQVCIGSSPVPNFEYDLSKSVKNISDDIPEEEFTENIEVDSEVKKQVKCPTCENCIDCNERPEYLDVCPSVCVIKTPEEEGCPTCIGCIDCNKHPEYLEECPEVCKTNEEDKDDDTFVVCPDCVNCIDCSGRPTFIKYCPSVCKIDEAGEIIDNGGDNDNSLVCPTCENCIDCDEHPEYITECPGVCIDPEAFTSDIMEEEPSIEEVTITCPVCKHCIDCDESPIYMDICPEVCMTEKEINANKKEKNEDIVCPSCIECIDCSKYPEYIDACPDVCEIDNDDDDTQIKPKKCPDCVGCIDCTKHPKYLIDCPTACRRVVTEEELDIETEGLKEESLSFSNAISDVDCPKCEKCIDCNGFPDYRIHCPTVCKDEAQIFTVEDNNEENNNEIATEAADIVNNAVKEEEVHCPPCKDCVDCVANPKYLKACPNVCHFEVEDDKQRDIDTLENEEEHEENVADEITEEVVATDDIENETLPITCPECKNCVDCEQNPQYIKVCPEVCIAVEEVIEETEKITEDITEANDDVEVNTDEIQEQIGNDVYEDEDDEDEEEFTEVFTEKLEEEKTKEEKEKDEKERKEKAKKEKEEKEEKKTKIEEKEKETEKIKEEEDKDEEEKEEDVTEVAEVTETSEKIKKCPACKECKDCSKNPEYIDSCPGVCKKDPSFICPMCMGCMDCSKKPLMKINCPTTCGI